MALGDITMLTSSSDSSGRGARLYNVAAGTPIAAGEPVCVLALGNTTVIPVPSVDTFPDQTAHLMVGIAATNSTNTTTAAGSVNVIPINSRDTWLIAPAVPASWDTQAEYDALVGKRVLFQSGTGKLAFVANVNAGTYSILASDSANNGLVVQALDISRYPGKVAFAFRDGTNYLT